MHMTQTIRYLLSPCSHTISRNLASEFILNQVFAPLLTGMWMLLQLAVGKQHLQAINPCTLFEVLHVEYKHQGNRLQNAAAAGAQQQILW